MFLPATFVPIHLTLTANKGETVNLSMQLLSSQKRDVTWKYNGRPVQTEAEEGTIKKPLTYMFSMKDLNKPGQRKTFRHTGNYGFNVCDFLLSV